MRLIRSRAFACSPNPQALHEVSNPHANRASAPACTGGASAAATAISAAGSCCVRPMAPRAKRSSRRRVRRQLRDRAGSAGSCSKRGEARRVELTVLAGEQIEQQPIVGLPVDQVALPLPADEAKAEPLGAAPRGVVLDDPGIDRMQSELLE